MAQDTSKDTLQNAASDAREAAENMTRHAGDAARRVGGAAKSAGQEVGSVARDEFEKLRADLDDLISRIPNLSDVDLEEAKEKLMAKIADTRAAAHDLAEDAQEQFDYAVECSKECIREHPLQSVGYAAGIGLIIGLLLARR
ncbi:MAG: hypothetical protein ABS69_12425 [Nitrosomonadales bacterium SCN 54-20]|nr:MAG: hypothetical protein ABS69_12425 [Nitrosomonadales bacterium SCN 54-20]